MTPFGKVLLLVLAAGTLARGAAAQVGEPEESSLAATTMRAAHDEIAHAPWRREAVGVGVVFRYHHFEQLFGRQQSVSVLDVDLRRRGVMLRFAAAGPERRRTSAIAQPTRAVAAVNGGFFDVEHGTPEGLLRIDGQLVRPGTVRRGQAVGVDSRERVRFAPSPVGDWPEVEHARGAGPLLVRAGRVRAPVSDKRHPRTAIGATADAGLVLLTVDGRTPESSGMTLLELAHTMLALGCTEAINLDGGGSTCMWVRGAADGGVASFPCDNGQFDHLGERAVADAVLVLAPDIVEADEDAATLEPEGAWRRDVPDADSVGGDCALGAGNGAVARFELKVELPGSYRLSLRIPSVDGASEQVVCEAGGEERRIGAGRARGGWVPAGSVEVAEAGNVRVRLRAAGQGLLAVDAVRLTERR